jgi:hypothetical protein
VELDLYFALWFAEKGIPYNAIDSKWCKAIFKRLDGHVPTPEKVRKHIEIAEVSVPYDNRCIENSFTTFISKFCEMICDQCCPKLGHLLYRVMGGAMVVFVDISPLLAIGY